MGSIGLRIVQPAWWAFPLLVSIPLRLTPTRDLTPVLVHWIWRGDPKSYRAAASFLQRRSFPMVMLCKR